MVGGEEDEANTSGIHRLGNLESFLLIASEDDTAEAEFSIIGQVDRIIELGVFHDGDDRPENLFAGHPHVMGDIGEHRRLDKEAICQFTGGFPTAGGDAASRVGTRRDSVEGLDELEEGREAGQAQSDSEQEYGAALQHLVDAKQFPQTAAMLTSEVFASETTGHDESERDFLDGLEIILDGLAARVGKGSPQ